jgi:hypothetical protein
MFKEDILVRDFIKRNITLILTIAGLIITAAVLVLLNKDFTVKNKQLNNEAVFIVMENEQEIKKYSMEMIYNLGETTFEANLKSSGKDPVKHTYTGVLLKSILNDAGVLSEQKNYVIITAADGYAVTVTRDKFMDDDNVYLAYKRDNELLGKKEDGGNGPYQMIIRKDPFSQYWCKYALSADIR